MERKQIALRSLRRPDAIRRALLFRNHAVDFGEADEVLPNFREGGLAQRGERLLFQQACVGKVVRGEHVFADGGEEGG